MQATTVDLRYKTKNVLRSLERGESVTITYRGVTKGVIVPPRQDKAPLHVWEHPFFNSATDSSKPVDAVMDLLRGGRFRDL